MGKLRRKSIRLKNYNYSKIGTYYITICTNKKECIFGNISNGKMITNENGNIVGTFWKNLPKKYKNCKLDKFIIMPNHLHGLIIIESDNVGAIHELPLQKTQRRSMLLPKIIGYFKMNTAKKINQIRQSPGERVWQRNYFERIIRNNKELNKIKYYISKNPIKWEHDSENPNFLNINES